MSEENITIMILKGVKRVRSIKVNRGRIRFVVWGGSVFAFLFVISIGLNVYQYVFLNGAEQFARTDTGEAEPANEVQTAIGTNGNNQNGFTANSSGQTASNGTNHSTAENDNPLFEETDFFAGDKSSSVVGLVDLKESVQLNGAELNVTFSIYKKDILQEAVSGRFVVLVKTSDASNPYLSYPQVTVNSDGSIKNFVDGESFFMRNLTIKERQILLVDRTSEFEYYRIFIYSNAGELLLRQTRLIDRNTID